MDAMSLFVSSDPCQPLGRSACSNSTRRAAGMDADVAVVGAGVVGSAVAMELSRRGATRGCRSPAATRSGRASGSSTSTRPTRRETAETRAGYRTAGGSLSTTRARRRATRWSGRHLRGRRNAGTRLHQLVRQPEPDRPAQAWRWPSARPARRHRAGRWPPGSSASSGRRGASRSTARTATRSPMTGGASRWTTPASKKRRSRRGRLPSGRGFSYVSKRFTAKRNERTKGKALCPGDTFNVGGGVEGTGPSARPGSSTTRHRRSSTTGRSTEAGTRGWRSTRGRSASSRSTPSATANPSAG